MLLLLRSAKGWVMTLRQFLPEGFAASTWEPGKVIKDFMIWTKLGRDAPQWHRAKVTKVLAPNTTTGYTHDARFADGIRGVRLSQEAYDDGCWVTMVPVASGNAQRLPTQNTNNNPPATHTSRGRTPTVPTNGAPNVRTNKRRRG